MEKETWSWTDKAMGKLLIAVIVWFFIYIFSLFFLVVSCQHTIFIAGLYILTVGLCLVYIIFAFCCIRDFYGK